MTSVTASKMTMANAMAPRARVTSGRSCRQEPLSDHPCRSRGQDGWSLGDAFPAEMLRGEKASQELFAPIILPTLSSRLHLTKTTVPRGHQDLGSTEPGPPTRLRKGGEGTHRH